MSSTILLEDPLTKERKRVPLPEGSPGETLEPPKKTATFVHPVGWGALEIRVAIANPEVLRVRELRADARGNFDLHLENLKPEEREKVEAQREAVYVEIDQRYPLPKELVVYRVTRIPVMSAETLAQVVSALAELGFGGEK